LDSVAAKIAAESIVKMAGGGVSAGTDMGDAMRLLARELTVPPMASRALPPVLVLISDGQPTDDFERGLALLMKEPWGKKAVRIAIAIGHDADDAVLQRFIGHQELTPLHANNPEDLIRFIRWASTSVLQAASSPSSQIGTGGAALHVPVPAPPDSAPSDDGVW
jgi:uncharacterized protein YegL